MTAQPHDPFVPGVVPDPAKSLRAIRAALVVRQDRGAFDAGLKAVLDEVRVNLDLGVLNDFVHRWWISACDSARDPEGRRRMHARADQVQAGEPPPVNSVSRPILSWKNGVRCTCSVLNGPEPCQAHEGQRRPSSCH
ncbi:MAG TPA: DUF6247 family protein [Streptosporangiaceae bacterium]|nr:DUF6247 family protein [Streptosporangiaceae bacterium]